MRVVILYPVVAPDASLEDQDTLVQVETVKQSLVRLGHEPVLLSCGLNLAAVRDSLVQARPELVFNLVESVEGADSLAHLVSSLLDSMGVPYTGSPTETLFHTNHKVLAKQFLQAAGLPTPAWIAVGQVSNLSNVGQVANLSFEGLPSDGSQDRLATCPTGKCIIKAVWEHASRGLDDENILSAEPTEHVRQRLREYAARFGRPCFAEQFIEGREFNLSLLDGPEGPEALPPAEIDFSAFPPEKLRIVGHRAKWEEDSFEFHHTPRRFDFPPGDCALLDELRNLALACWRLFGLRGHVRVDFRVDPEGQPWILEVNTNPCLSPDAGYAAALDRAGIPFDTAIQRIFEASLPTAP